MNIRVNIPRDGKIWFITMSSFFLVFFFTGSVKTEDYQLLGPGITDITVMARRGGPKSELYCFQAVPLDSSKTEIEK